MSLVYNSNKFQYAVSQSLPFGELRRGFPFNAFNCMKAYSYNGERYGYYGYDASGERTYKMGLDKVAVTTSQGGVDITNIYWEVGEMMFYPNGYINVNQNGQYTKHYYADALRIASKIGSGFSQDLCYEANQIGNEVDPDYLDVRMNKQHDEMMEELTELINGNQITSINPIPYPEADLCNLSGSGIETALFFYHPDHLGSTGMVTDNISNYTQGMLYAPFGEIICDYNPTFHDSPMPNYAFNAKELDEENNMYYYSARYYAPPTFISRDPMFEKKFTSPYAYCLNNPLRFIDPDGRDEWEINKQGEVRWIKESDKHTLFALNENGDRTGASLTLKDRTIFDGLAESGANSDYSLSTATGGENSQDAMLQTFKFAADNTNVEWRVDRFRAEGGGSNYSIGTIHNTGFAPTAEAMGHSKSSVIAFIHSHPNTSLADERYSMGSYYPRTDIPKLGGSVDGDCRVKRSDYPNTPYYMYSPNSGNVWAVSTKGASSHQFIRKVRNHKGFMFGTLNTR